MKKIVIFTFAILAILFVARQALLPQLIERGFAKSVSENIGIDRSAALEDGLHIYICGAGSPLPDPKRSGPCIGVLAGKQAFIFDAGTGGSRNLGAMGFPLGQTEQIFLTHLHSDHFDGLGEMLLGTWINGGFFVINPEIKKYLHEDANDIMWERQPLLDLSKDKELVGYKYSGFWKAMDTLRDKQDLEKQWASNPLWKKW